jgi:hypothetical protein
VKPHENWAGNLQTKEKAYEGIWNKGSFKVDILFDIATHYNDVIVSTDILFYPITGIIVRT